MSKETNDPPRRPGEPDALWQASQLLPQDVDRGFFVEFWQNGELDLAWKELAAAGKAELASAEFWNLMAETARSLGLVIEERAASLRAHGGTLIEITIPVAEALVLFEFLSCEGERTEAGEHSGYEFEHPAERYAIWYLLATFEEHLPEPFTPFYQEALARARNEVVEKWGGEEADDAV